MTRAPADRDGLVAPPHLGGSNLGTTARSWQSERYVLARLASDHGRGAFARHHSVNDRQETLAASTTPFPGRSEMAALMRAFDWRGAGLPAPADWPESLKAVTRIMLTSRYAMWMGWGEQLTFTYNDAYGAMTLGTKHPWALGRPAREVWAE